MFNQKLLLKNSIFYVLFKQKLNILFAINLNIVFN